MSNAAVIKEICARDKSISFVIGPSVNIPRQQEKATEAVENFIKKENNRYYLQEGAIWPSNDENAVGIVAKDTDITDGAVTFALVVDGVVRVECLPAEPSPEAVAALGNIQFVPKQDGIEIPKYLISIPSVENATIAVVEGSSLLVQKGGLFSFTVTAAASHSVSSVKVNGETIEADDDDVYTISDIDADQAIEVVIA